MADSGYDGLDTVTVNAVPTATQATPTISVNSSTGLITATATQTAGYVAAGTKSATSQLAFQAAKTITPGTTNQTAVTANTYVGGTVTVKGDSNLVASNIVSGKSIFGVVGTATAGVGGSGDNCFPNGTSWTMSNISTGNVHKVMNGGGVWVATIDNDFYYSSDGKTWTKSFTANAEYTDLCYANGKWVAVSDSSTAAALYHSVNGQNWTAVANTTIAGIRQIHYAHGLYHITSTSGVYSSTDAITWTYRQIVNNQTIVYGNGRWATLSTASGEYRIKHSIDGTSSWATIQLGSSKSYGCLSFLNGIWYYAECSGADLGLYYSTDFVTWQRATTSANLPVLDQIEYGNGVWVCCSNNGVPMYSLDGKNWSTGTLNSTTNQPDSLRYANGIWIAAKSSGRNGCYLYHSYNGQNWYSTTLPASFNAITDYYCANGIWVLGTSSGLAYSVTWEPSV